MSKPIEGNMPASMAEPGAVEELGRVRLQNRIIELQNKIERMHELSGKPNPDLESIFEQIEQAQKEKQGLEEELESLGKPRSQAAKA